METKSRRVKLPTITEKPRYCSFNGYSTQPMFTRRVDFLIMSSVNIFDLCLLISMPTSFITSIARGLISLTGLVPALDLYLEDWCMKALQKKGETVHTLLECANESCPLPLHH